MLGVFHAVAETAGDSGGSSGISAIVLAIYGAIFLFALVSWIAWGIRQERGGVIQWGEQPPAESFGEKFARWWRTASAPPTPTPYERPAPEPEPAFEEDERQRTAG
jgi:hypothetical protein